MPRTLFEPVDRAEVRRRIGGIPADRRPLWGRMDAPRMVVHCTDALRMATGDVPIAILPIGRVLGLFGIGRLLARRMPFPKGAPTHPTLVARRATAYGDELERFDAALEAFAARAPNAQWAPHPLFGPLDAATWGVLAWRHLDHHLRQFGA